MSPKKHLQALSARLPVALFVALAAGAGAAPRAGAATVVGEVSPPYEYAQCSGSITVETGVPAAARPYVVPANGVITSWSTATANYAGTAKLKVLHPTGAKEYVVVGEDGPHPVAAGTSPTFTGVRVPVHAGDVIALLAKGTNCMAWFPGGGFAYAGFALGLDPAPGGSATVSAFGVDFAIAVSATVEPDADGDGYGDETQDACPGDASAHTLPCPVPSAAPTAAPATAPTAESAPPRITLSGPARQAPLRAGDVLEVATVDMAASLRATGSVRIAGTRAALPLKPASARGTAGTGTLLRLRIPARTGRALRAALRRGRRVTASLSVTATDAASNSSQATQTVAIRGSQRRS